MPATSVVKHEGKLVGRVAMVQIPTSRASVQLASQLVDIDLVDEDPKNARLEFDAAKLQQLADEMKADGQLVPCIVRRVGDRFRLVDGARRYRALKLLSAKKIRVEVQDLDDKQAAVASAVANLQRESLTPYEEARAIQTVLDAGLNKKEACARAGLVFNTLQGRLDLLKLPVELAQLAGHGNFSLAHAQAVAPLAGHAVTGPKGKVVLMDLVVALVRDAVRREDVPALWNWPHRVAEHLVHTHGVARMTDFHFDAASFKEIPHVDLGDGQRANNKRLYLDVEAFDARLKHLQDLEAKRRTRNAAAARSGRGGPEPAWKRANRLHALAGVETRRLMQAAIVATLKSGKNAAGDGLWALIVKETWSLDDVGSARDKDDEVLDCAKLAAAAAGVDQDVVATTFALQTTTKDLYTPRTDLRKLAAPPTWWTKQSRDHQAAFAVAFLGGLAAGEDLPPGAAVLLTGHKVESFETKAKKAAEKTLAAQEAAAKTKKRKVTTKEG